MPRLVPSATRIPVPGDKQIDEYIGRVNTKDAAVSIAHMHSPSGWSEPGQQPEFDEYTVVLKGVAAGGIEERRPGSESRTSRHRRRAANGCATARRDRRAPSISRCAWRRSTLILCIATPDLVARWLDDESAGAHNYD